MGLEEHAPEFRKFLERQRQGSELDHFDFVREVGTGHKVKGRILYGVFDQLAGKQWLSMQRAHYAAQQSLSFQLGLVTIEGQQVMDINRRPRTLHELTLGVARR